MKRVYIKCNKRGQAHLELGNGERIPVPSRTVQSAARYDKVTQTLRNAIQAASGEEVLLVDLRTKL